MKRICTALLTFLIIASLTAPLSFAASVPSPVMGATESVVRILAEYKDGYASGSGFIIESGDGETLVVTNYHVVEENPYSISVWLGEEETVTASILAYTNQKDMCVLKLAYPVSLQPAVLAKDGAKQGEAVYAVGFPSGADYLSDKEAHTSADATITDGIVSAVREATVSDYGMPTKILQINAALNAGNSGGPLFNSKGEVVGINTYGIDDSQGIFGAIDISELKSFLADQSIYVQNTGGGFPWLLLVAAAVLIFGLAAVLFFIIKRKKRGNAPVKAEIKNIPLREYMAAYPDGLGMNDAVAMLLPVALQLRDLHNNGNVHLQISPNSVFVGANGAILADATPSESDRYASGYAAPEIYKGKSAGNLSDIYSFCAVLSYAASGKPPANSLSRMEEEADDNEVSEPFDAAFSAMLKTGMALEPADRFASMQDVIIKLSPYNIQPFANKNSPAEESAPAVIPEKKKKHSPKLVAAIAAAVIIFALLGTYFGCYLGARSNAKNGDFEAADSLLIFPQLTKLHDAKLVSYIEAGRMLTERKYEAAKGAFAALSGYLDSNTYVQEADYRRALQYADANEFDQAINIMSELGQAGYSDAADKLLDIQYRKGTYVLYEENDYSEAADIFYQLSQENYDGAAEMRKETLYLWSLSLIEDEEYIEAYKLLITIRSYSDVDDILTPLMEFMYSEGQKLYHISAYDEAEEYFSLLGFYANSESYCTLIKAKREFFSGAKPDGLYRLMYNLESIFYFEDASEVLLYNHYLACLFLRDEWRTGSGSYYFKMEDEYNDGDFDFYASYNLPYSHSGSFSISYGTFYIDDYPQFSFTLITPDCMDVYCYANGATYTLYRHRQSIF